MLYLAADHAGYAQKEQIKKYLNDKGVELTDVGTDHLDPADDYPDFAIPALSKMNPETDKAILFCGSGQGMAILANKFKGIRAAVVYDDRQAVASRQDDDANVMTVGSRFEDTDMVKRAADLFLTTAFSGAERHIRRLNKIKELDK